jgi:glycosyltransferase involved in cell wall biosynthesis
MKRLENSEHPISLIYFGRFVPYKGLDRMIRAVWKARCISGRAFVLDLVGSGDELTRLRTCVNELGAEDAIRFNDQLPYGQRLFAKIREAAPRDPVRLGKLIGESNRQDMASKAIPIRTTFRPATPSGKIWILGWVIVE